MGGPGDYHRKIWGGGKYDLVHFLGSYLDADLDDIRSENRILDAIRCDGALELNLPSVNSPLRYLVVSQTLIFLSKMANGIPNRNPTTRANADTSLPPGEFYEPGLNQKVAIREMGVEAFNDFI